jgi:hypothetical protein
MTARPGPAAVKVRVSADLPGIASAPRALHDAAQAGGFEIADQTRPYPNRREPGFRVYVTLRFPPQDPSESCGAAHNRQAIRRPAAPRPVKDPGKRHHP